MSMLEQNVAFMKTLQEIDRSARAVEERGYDNVPQEWDDYASLLESYEFRKLVTFELYDSYFPPKRHEFELHLLTELVDVIASNKLAAFLAVSAAGGIIGNAAYDMLKSGLAHIMNRFSKIRRTHDAVREISGNVENIHAYIEKHDDFSTSQISCDLGIESHKVEPILKLLGCRSHRIQNRRLWRKPRVG